MDTTYTTTFGTCSWKYDSWRGLVYSEKGPVNYLKEYSKRYKTVEVDQWFWSLFNSDTPVLPRPSIVEEYAASVPENFTFAIKVPNSVTLTHHYKKGKNAELIPNPHFLSVEIMERFLTTLEPITNRIGALIFQFEYLNTMKMAGLDIFISKFSELIQQLPKGYRYCLEPRNPNYLKTAYFTFLAEQNLSHVFLQGYYMPPIFDLYEKHKEQLGNFSVIRLHGPDRKEIEKQTGKNWNNIVAPKDTELHLLVRMLSDMPSGKSNPLSM